MCVGELASAVRVFISERQVLLSQRGEALLHALLGHVLQSGRLPLGTLVLVHQHCHGAENNNLVSKPAVCTLVVVAVQRLTGSYALVKVMAPLGRRKKKM